MPPGPSRGLPSDLKRSRLLRAGADESNASVNLFTDSMHTCWALQGPGSGPGKALNTEVTVQVTDYVTRAPGALVTPHPWREQWPRYVANVDRLPEGAVGTLCAHSRPIALHTLRNVVFRLFRHFPPFPGFSTDSGGPSLPL